MTAPLPNTRAAATERRGSVAYVMTHYPRVALTFIAGEIDAVERRGITIHPFAMNMPADVDLGSEVSRARRDRTTYLKASWPRALGAFFRHGLKHPLAMTRLAARALSISGWDVGLAIRRMAHLVEAALLAQESTRRGVKHIHAHFGLAPATIAWFASDIMNLEQPGGVRWSFTIHGFHDFVDDAEARLDLKAATAAFVVCISDFTKSQLCRITHPQHWDRFHVVRCGIDLEKFAFRGERALAEKPRIITVGRLAAEKGQLILLRAIAALRERGIEVELTLVGDGPLKGWIEGEISRLGLKDQVLLTGEVSAEEVNSYLVAADIFCLSSFSEGLPVAIMEAMAIGVPVVSTYIAGIPELAIDGKTALTVPAGNVDALAEALARMITDDEFRKEAVRAAHKEVVQRHDRERNADQLASMLAPLGVSAR